MGLLGYYRDIEDHVRSDSSEGFGHIQRREEIDVGYFTVGKPDEFEVRQELAFMHHRSVMGNPIFIFSTSQEGVDIGAMRERFGRYVVCIENPVQLAQDITAHLACGPATFGAGVEGRIIQYNQGEVLDEELEGWDFIAMSYRQKPSNFGIEKEFRYIAINTNEHEHRIQCDYIEIDLGGPLEYLTLIHPDE